MRITREQGQNYSGGGVTYFKIKDNESVRVRFLYNTLNDIEYLAAHSLRQNGQYATVDCSRLPEDPIDNCKWCAEGDRVVSRVVIPLFNLGTNKIEYWVRSQSFVDGTLIPILEQIPANQPISGQLFIIKRTKTGSLPTDVSYTVMAELGTVNDGKQRTEFGEIQDPLEAGIIKPNDYTFPIVAPQNNNTATQQNNFTSTRRTNDIF